MELGKYSLGTGDRFGRETLAQLKAIDKAKKELGLDITPVWNKSNREHQLIGSSPAETRKTIEGVMEKSKWKGKYFLDADHINLSNVDRFMDPCNFFTIDVADYIGKPAEQADIKAFLSDNQKWIGNFDLPGLGSYPITADFLENFANRYLFAIQEASKIYQYIEAKKGKNNFITEVSMDEVQEPQHPLELLFILKQLAQLKVPVQTLAPRFSGNFYKGVDYAGDIVQFEKEFEADLLVLDYAVKNFGLPAGLKLSIHSGSDKFSIYPVMGKLIRKYNQGIHLKTAGTTWLEELIGLTQGTPEGLDLVKAFYTMAYRRMRELCAPYSTVLHIEMDELPEPSEISKWKKEELFDALNHNQQCERYNPSFRQLMHVAFKVAAEYGIIFTEALDENREIIENCVTTNLYDRHILPLLTEQEEQG